MFVSRVNLIQHLLIMGEDLLANPARLLSSLQVPLNDRFLSLNLILNVCVLIRCPPNLFLNQVFFLFKLC